MTPYSPILFGVNREEVKAQITYLGKESISTNIGKRACYKLAISSSENVLQGKNNNLLWLTADENKIIVYGKFKEGLCSNHNPKKPFKPSKYKKNLSFKLYASSLKQYLSYIKSLELQKHNK